MMIRLWCVSLHMCIVVKQMLHRCHYHYNLVIRIVHVLSKNGCVNAFSVTPVNGVSS
jgi:hypothetical protein